MSVSPGARRSRPVAQIHLCCLSAEDGPRVSGRTAGGMSAALAHSMVWEVIGIGNIGPVVF